jgi:cytochrome b pre-mRNA-processing protein 3
MKDVLEQYHGSISAYDEGLIKGDAVLAAAIWRNIFGGGWGGIGGVVGKRAPKAGEVPALGPNPNPSGPDFIQAKAMKKGAKESDLFTTDEAIVDPKRVGRDLIGGRYPEDPELEFAQSLEKMVKFVRMELQRLERLPEANILNARPDKGPASLTGFTKIP